MPTQIFVNLPVKHLDTSIAFFTSLGYSFNPQFTDETATCMIIADNIFVMLLVEPFFETFVPRAVADPHKCTGAILCLSADSRNAVDALVKKAVDAGGTIYKQPQDHGFMYGHGYQDLDGHLWEIMWMDTSAVNED